MSTSDGIWDDLDAMLEPWKEDFSQKLYGELVCLGRTVIIHDENNNVRKLLSIIFFSVWAVAFLGRIFHVATVGAGVFIPYTAIVFVIIGRIWDIEASNYAPFITEQQQGDK